MRLSRGSVTRWMSGVVLGLGILTSGCGSRPVSAPVDDLKPPPDINKSVTAGSVRDSAGKRADTAAAAPAVAATANAEPQVTDAKKIKPTAAASQATKSVAAKVDEPSAEAPAKPYRDGDWRPEYYIVRKGDTLYSIALDFGRDYRELAQWNQLADPGYIRVGQQLRLFPRDGEPGDYTPEAVALPAARLPSQTPAAMQPQAPTFTEPKAYRAEYSAQALAEVRGFLAGEAETVVVAAPDKPAEKVIPVARPSASQTPPVAQSVEVGRAALPDEHLRWEWPAPGTLMYRFNEGQNKKGVAIEGVPGQAVVSGAPGKVVYSGSGLRGYGNLIIVKHNATYLSVYAHNSQLLVKEGQMVAQGQKIAVMGETSQGQTALHFEIRRLGKPVDPLKLLPDRPS